MSVVQNTQNREWQVGDLISQRIGAIQLDKEALKSLPASILDGLKCVYSAALNTSAAKGLLGEKETTPFILDFSVEEGVTLKVDTESRKIEAPRNFIRKIGQVYAAAERMGLGKKTELSDSQIERAKQVSEIFKKASQERKNSAFESSPRTLKSYIWSRFPEAIGVTIDSVSLLRNSLAALSTPSDSSIALSHVAAKVQHAVGVLAIGGGAMSVISGGFIAKSAFDAGKKAIKREDIEGGVLASLNGAIGLNYSTLGASMVTQNVATFAGSASVAAAGSTVLLGTGFAMYGALAIGSGIGIGINASFRSEMNAILENENRSESDRLFETLVWMRQKATLSEFEAIEITEKARAEGKDPKEELEKALQRKWDQFERRSSGISCQLVRERVTPELLEKLKAGDSKALEEARFIVTQVSEANFRQLSKSVLLMVIAILGILAFVGAIVVSGPFSPALFALGAALWILVDSKWVHGKFGDLLWHVRNQIWPEWSSLKGRVCPIQQLAISSPISERRRGYRKIPSTLTEETSRHSRRSLKERRGQALRRKTSSRSSRTSRKALTHHPRSAAS